MHCEKENNQLIIKNLSISFNLSESTIQAVKGINLSIEKGKITALVGESGSGKTVTSLAILGLLEKNASIESGEIFIMGQNILSLKKREFRKKRSEMIGVIFQEPVDSLNPTYSVGNQLMESICIHKKMKRKQAFQKACDLLEMLEFSEPQKIMRKYPFELSGGMCQRIMIAIAMIGNPSFLIADEPTTALDVSVQKTILKQILDVVKKKNMGVLLITHDLGVVAEIADDVYIMKEGQILEYNTVAEIFDQPKHPYTQKLMNAIF